MGRLNLKPIPVYYFLTAANAFLLALAMMVSILFQVSEAGLNPLQLVLVGTALEATIFLCEVPTGIVADVFSRRLSVLLGFIVSGLGLILTGAYPEFGTILLGSIVWGIGFTFISGARHAWISDEIGAQEASKVFLRGSQFELFGRIAAIPIAVAIAQVFELNTPILLAGGLFIVLAFILAPIMPETGFRRGAGTRRSAMTGTFRAGSSLVFASPLLMTVFGIALFYGMSSEGFDRLWEAHFLLDLGFPDWPSNFDLLGWNVAMEPVVWFGVIRMGSTVFSLGAAEVAHRRLNLNSHRTVSRWLFVINITQVLSLLIVALAGGFWMGVIGFWIVVTLSRVYDPLYLGWINQNIRSDVRATVLSMSSQADSLGQIAGGPFIGVVGSVISIRAALVAASAALLPALLLYLRAFNLGSDPADNASAKAAPEPDAEPTSAD